nr:hypothetical protein [Tanacetum cinerariifolium]
MTTLAEYIIVAGAENHPPMLEKSMYDSWASRIRLFIKEKKHEWSKFVTDVKLAKSLYTTNYDQLYAYFTQHERHTNEVCISHERYPDSHDFLANPPTLYNPSQSPQHSGYSMYPPPQQYTPVYAAPIHHQHHHSPFNLQQHPVSPPPFISPSITQPSEVEFPQLDSSLVVPMFQQGEDLIECINKLMAFLSAVASRRRAYGDIVYSAKKAKEHPGISEAPVSQQTIPQNSAFQIDDMDAYDSDCDDLSIAKAVLMGNLSSCDPEVLFEVPFRFYPNDMINQDVQEMQYSEQTHDTNPSAPNDLLVLSLVGQMTYHVTHLDKENQTNKMILILKKESRSKMLDKQNDIISIEKKIKVSPIYYSKLNKIKEDFGKRFVTKKELSIEQAFWLKHSSFSETPVTSNTTVRIEAPSELSK